MADTDIITRAQAIEKGLSQYFTGTPCRHGHIAPRYTKGSRCTECNRLSCKRRHQERVDADPDRRAAQQAHRLMLKEAKIRRQRYEAQVQPWRQASKARKAAIENGDRTYFSPKPCPQGHVGDRYTSGGWCVTCAQIASASPKKKDYDRNYYWCFRERISEVTRQYREKNKERVDAGKKRWARKNKNRVRAIKQAYKSRRRSKERKGISGRDLLSWESAQRKICYWCGARCSSRYHVDHYFPLAKGGEHVTKNLVIACPPCNQRKSAKDPYEFAKSVGRLF